MARRTEASRELFARCVRPGWEAHDRAAAAELEADFLLPHRPEHRDPQHRGHHLLVTTRQDALVGWRDQLALLDHHPRMAAAVLDGVGHNPQVEAADAEQELHDAEAARERAQGEADRAGAALARARERDERAGCARAGRRAGAHGRVRRRRGRPRGRVGGRGRAGGG
ncbi:hypothetical protein ACFWJ4_22965 [Kitasatospora sp. NPDC127067]|uniref:hypothetical protein n=1 Tax=Kitasatospora sp. NPDC127067 TaxID=3347126 RepID=UPI00365C3EB0